MLLSFDKELWYCKLIMSQTREKIVNLDIYNQIIKIKSLLKVQKKQNLCGKVRVALIRFFIIR